MLATCFVWAANSADAVCYGDANQQQGESPANRPVVESSTKLIADLDDRHFERRQQAAEKLVAIGETLLRPLAIHCLDASPESNWRIKKVIEQIGTSGSEHTFYRSTGILNLLFHSNQAPDNQRIQQLIERWRLVRKDKAIKDLRSLGVKIDNPIGELGDANNARRQWMMANNPAIRVNQMVVNGVEVQSTGSTASASTSDQDLAEPNQRSLLSRERLVEKIDEILTADVEVLREQILDGQQQAAASKNATALANQQRLVLQANMMGGINMNRLGVTIALDDQFEGTPEDLRLVRQIPDVSDIRFANRRIDRELLSCFHDIDSIVAVSFDNCTFDDAPLPVSSWPRTASSVAFANQKLTGEILQSFSDSLLVRRVALNACQLADDAYAELQNLTAMTEMLIQETSLDSKYFEMFAELPAVSRLTFSLCKFDTADYRELKLKKPQLRIDFTPQAFLGIRGTDARMLMLQQPLQIPNDGNADPQEMRRRIAEAQRQRMEAKPAGCVVSEVIRGSGAARGGIQAGDLIKEIDGQPITQFEDLRLHIAQHKVGEKLKVKIVREKKTETITITLGSFRNANQ